MKLNNEEINIFEKDEDINTFCLIYYQVKKEFNAKKYPPTENNFCKELKAKYNYDISMDEFYELKDFAENDYKEIIAEQIKSDFESGFITEIKEN